MIDPPSSDDKLHSDFIAGENISSQQMGSFSGVAIGRGVQDSMSQAGPGETLNALFSAVYQQIAASQATPQEQIELRGVVQRIEYELYRGSAASPQRLERMLRALNGQSPDLSQYLTDQLSQIGSLNPAIGKALNIGGMEAAAPPAPADAPETVVRRQIETAGLSPAERDRLLDCVSAIQEEIDKETSTKAAWVDVRRVQSALGELQRAARDLPGLRAGLWDWLVENEGIPPSVRILAKKLAA